MNEYASISLRKGNHDCGLTFRAGFHTIKRTLFREGDARVVEMCLLGTGGTLPLKDRALSSLYVRVNGRAMLADPLSRGSLHGAARPAAEPGKGRAGGALRHLGPRGAEARG